MFRKWISNFRFAIDEVFGRCGIERLGESGGCRETWKEEASGGNTPRPLDHHPRGGRKTVFIMMPRSCSASLYFASIIRFDLRSQDGGEGMLLLLCWWDGRQAGRQ